MDNEVSQNSSTNYSLPGIDLKVALTPKKLSVCCINVQSLCARRMTKFEELNQVVVTSDVDIVCVVETWLSDKTDNDSIHIDNYQIIRHDRVGRLGGGLLIYVKSNIKHKILDVSLNVSGSENTEFILAEIYTRNCKVLIGAFYNPPGLSCSELLYDKMIAFGVMTILFY